MDRRAFNLRLLTALGAAALPSSLLALDDEAWLAGPGASARKTPRVNGRRLNDTLRALSEFGRNERGGVSRVAYSEADRQGRAYVTGLMKEAGLEVTVDVAGNIIGRRAGRARELPPLMMGSHIDSVPGGGNYDGPVGSLAAIEAARVLGEQRVRLRHPLEVIVFQNEEGGLIGSSALSGQLDLHALDHKTHSGKTIAEGIAFIGGDPARLDSARRKPGDIAAYLELHIEQGAVLESEGLNIGVVEGIVGISQWEVTVTGMANHAGTTPMDKRRDALLAASQFVLAVNRIVTSEPGRQVGTVGRIGAAPGAPNVIPGVVTLSLELRDLDGPKIARLYRAITEEAQRIGEASGTTFAYRELHRNDPAPTDPRVRRTIGEAATELGLTSRVMPSGAGHDAQAMATLGPAGMIFVPSVGGISHSPKEFTKPEDVERGANVLLATLLRIDARGLR